MSEHELALPSAEDWRRAAEAGSRGAARGVAQGTVELPASIRDEVIAWCLAGRPNEACGIVAGDRPPLAGGRAVRFIGMANAAGSPYRYLLDPQEQLSVMLDLDDRGEEVWGIVHSHVASQAVPSATDVGLAYYPDSLYLVCSLASTEPELRAWTIRDGVASEIGLRISEQRS